MREYVTVVSGLRNKAGEGGVPHGITQETWLNCVHSAAAQRGDRRRRHGRPARGASLAEGRDAAVDGDLRRARRHDLVPHAEAAAADGRQPAQGLHLDVRAGPDERGAPSDPRHDDELARLRDGGDGQLESQARRRRSREGRQLSRLGSRGRAARAEAARKQRVAGRSAGRADRRARRFRRAARRCSSSCSRSRGRRTARTS